MANQRELDLLVKITTQGAEALGQIQQQITAIATTPFTFGGAIDSIRQLAVEFAKLNQTAEQNQAAKEGAKVASESAKAAQQLAKARSEEEKANQQAQKVETERLKTQKESLLLDQQTLKNETEKARAIKETANAEAAQERAQQAAIRTDRLKNQPEKKEGGEGLFGSITGAIPEIALVSAAFNQVTESIGKVGEFGRQVFEGLIAQVVEIRGQTLGIASAIAASQQIFVDNKKIENPLEAIQAVLPQVTKDIEQLKRDSTETISTTAELIPIYQAVAGQLSTLNISSSQAEKLAVRLSQAASGLNIPYQQAVQEIQSLTQGEITIYNNLAKRLGINQSTYTQLVAQGRLYDVLIERTAALAQGQKLAADQLPGALSTIRDSFELITQEAGGPLLDALLKPLIAFRDFFKANQIAFEGFAKSLSTGVVGAFDAIIEPIATELQPAFAALGDTITAIGQLFTDLGTTEGPALKETFGAIAQVVGSVLNAAIVGLANTVTLAVKAFDLLASNPAVKLVVTNIGDSFKAAGQAIAFVIDQASKFGTVIDRSVGAALDNLKKILNGLVDNPAFQVFAKSIGVNIEDVKKSISSIGETGSKSGEEAAKGFKTANLALDDLGKTSDLIKVQLSGAFRDLGNRDKAEDAAKRIITLTQQALENGTISRAEAERNLKALQDNTGLQLDTRLNAEKAATKIIQDGGKERLDAIKTREAQVQNAVKAGNLSQIEGDRQLTELKQEELDKQIEITQKALEREGTEGRGLGPRATELRNQLQQQQVERTAIAEKGNRDRAAAELTGADNELKVLEGKRVSGKLSEEAFANESLAITRKRIDAELKELERERALLKPGDKAGQQDIDAKEAALNGKREAAEEQFQQRKLAIVERAQKRAEDAAKLSEVSRNTEIDKLLAARQIRETEAGLLRVQSSRATIAKELELEKAKTAELAKQTPLSDPVKEEERQVKIRASRIKTAELADSLVKNEIEAQQALFRVVSERLDRQAQAAKNAAEGQVQPLQAQLQLQDALSKSLDNQNKLLESRKGLQSALSGYLEGELGILAKSAKTDDEKQKIAQLTAATKFKALQQQQAIEQQSLEIQIKQNEAALAREKIQNRIAKLQNAADVAQAQADLAKAKAKPDATPEEIEAAKLNLEAKQLAGKGLDQQGELLQQQGKINEVSAQNQRQVLALKQQGELDQGKQGLIDALPEGAKQQAQQNLTQEILQRLGLGNAIGDINTDQITNATLQQRGVGNFGFQGQFNPVAGASPELANSPKLNKLLDEFQVLAGGKGAGKKENQASDLETSLKQQQEADKGRVEGQNIGADRDAKARKEVIDALEKKRTQLVALQGKQADQLESIEKSVKALNSVGGDNGEQNNKGDSSAKAPSTRSANESQPIAPQPSDSSLNVKQQGTADRLGVSGDRVQAELQKNATYYNSLNGDNFKRAAEKLAVEDSIKNRIALEKAGKLKPREGAALALDYTGTTALSTPSLVQPQRAIAPIAGNGGNPQMQATLEKIHQAIETSQLRPVQATVNNSIAGPDAATVVDLATKRMTDNLIGVLGRAK